MGAFDQPSDRGDKSACQREGGKGREQRGQRDNKPTGAALLFIEINIGIAGGLSSHLKPLEVILGTSFSHHDVRVDQMLHFFPFIDSFLADEKLIKKFAPHFDEKHQGKIVSGEGFINEESEKLRIIETFNPLLVDMETSSMAHCCLINEVPFISLRGISDLADASADVSYKANEQRAADKVGEKLLKVLKK